MNIKVSGTLKWYLTTGSHIVKKVESKQSITLEDATILSLQQELFESNDIDVNAIKSYSKFINYLKDRYNLQEISSRKYAYKFFKEYLNSLGYTNSEINSINDKLVVEGFELWGSEIQTIDDRINIINKLDNKLQKYKNNIIFMQYESSWQHLILYVMSNKVTDMINNPKTKDQIEKDKQSEKIKNKENNTKQVQHIYTSILSEFEDDMDDLYTAYEYGNKTFEGFVEELNNWNPPSWVSAIISEFNCTRNVAISVCRKIFNYVKDNYDKNN